MRKTLIVHPEDHMVVALTDLPAGSQIEVDGSQIQLANQVGGGGSTVDTARPNT